MLAEATRFLVESVSGMGYAGIFMLMCIESSFIPFPSEVVLIPAGYLAAKGEMHLAGIFGASLLGSLVGAYINYAIALLLGRRLLLRYGRYIFIPPATMAKMERFFERHGAVSTFTGRLIPGVRQLISVPAGLARMPLGTFSLFTAAGAGIWSTVLIALGYFIGDNEALIHAYLGPITLGILAVVAVVIAVYYRRQTRS